MMEHLIATLESGRSIGHYGRLVFVMVARHFLDADELVRYLEKDPECDEVQARALISQVEARNYNPPKRERILEWMRKQEFPVCPEPDDPGQCNVYRNLNFPQDVYDRINEFYLHGNN
jgi:DNA primase large subunit